MNRLLPAALVLGLAAIAAAHPPATVHQAPPALTPGVTVREFQVPQPPLVIERPPRIFQEITQVVEVTPRRAEVLELDSWPWWASSATWPSSAPRADRRDRFEVTRVGILGGVRHFSRDGDRIEVLRMGPLGGIRHYARDR